MEEEKQSYLQCRGHSEEDDVAHRRAPEQVSDLSKINHLVKESSQIQAKRARFGEEGKRGVTFSATARSPGRSVGAMEEEATNRTSARAAETRSRTRRSLKPSGQREGSHRCRRELAEASSWLQLQGSQSDGGSGAMSPRSRRGDAIAI